MRRSAGITAEGFGLVGPRGRVFQDVTFTAPSGSLVAVEGPSGSGRTCLLLALTGRMRATEDWAEVGGLRLPKHLAGVRRLAALGPVTGVAELDPALTVGEHLRERVLLQRRFSESLREPVRPRKERADTARRRIDRAVAEAGLDLERLPRERVPPSAAWNGRPRVARLAGPAQGGELRHRLRAVLHPLSLWVGAMVAYMLLQPLSKRALAAGTPAWRIAVAGRLPVLAIGVVQVAALMAVLHRAIGLQMLRAAGTVGFLLLAVACFTSIVQWLNARFGPAGRVLVLALLMLQLTSAGGTYPVQTSPGFFGAIHPFLPMSYVVEGLRHLITGGGLGPVWRACLVLSGFTACALTLTAWSARRKQVWTLDRLYPELSL